MQIWIIASCSLRRFSFFFKVASYTNEEQKKHNEEWRLETNSSEIKDSTPALVFQIGESSSSTKTKSLFPVLLRLSILSVDEK